MREILFRGRLHNPKAGWAYGNVRIDPGHKIYIITPDETLLGSYGAVLPETIGQYTGLTDKNGVKIFEGDVVLIDGFYVPLLVEFIDFSWVCTNKKVARYYKHKLGQDNPEYEVIGNIHDNPELLESRGCYRSESWPEYLERKRIDGEQ